MQPGMPSGNFPESVGFIIHIHPVHIHPIESFGEGKALLQKTCALLSSQLKGRRLLMEYSDTLEMLSIFCSISVSSFELGKLDEQLIEALKS